MHLLLKFSKHVSESCQSSDSPSPQLPSGLETEYCMLCFGLDLVCVGVKFSGEETGREPFNDVEVMFSRGFSS